MEISRNYSKNIIMSNMIKKYIEFLNEKLTDNLKGFDEQGLKQQFTNGEIDIEKYLQLCNKYNIEISGDEILKEYYLDNNFSIRKYLYLAQKYNYKLPENELINEFKNKKITTETYLDLSKIYLNKVPSDIEFKQMLLNDEINVYEYLQFARLYKIKTSLTDIELKQYYLDNNITIQEYIDCSTNFDNKPILTSDELKQEYINKNIDIEYYFMLLKKFKFEIPKSIISNILKLSIKQYKRDEITFENLMNFFNKNSLSLSKEVLINTFNFKIKHEKIELNTIIYFNDTYDLNLNDDEIFQCLGYEHSFKNPTEFIEYILNNYEKTTTGKYVIIKDNKEKMMSIHAYEYDGLINLNYDRITKVLDYWFNLNNKEINNLLNKIINKHYNFNVDFNVV